LVAIVFPNSDTTGPALAISLPLAWRMAPLPLASWPPMVRAPPVIAWNALQRASRTDLLVASSSLKLKENYQQDFFPK